MSNERTERMLRCIIQLKQLHGTQQASQLTGGESGVLFCLYRSGEARPGQISQRIHLSSARVTIVLNALERQGMVNRIPDKEDRRRVNISLTPAGKRYVEALFAKITAEVDQLLDYLGPEDSEAFLSILERLEGFCQSKKGGNRYEQPETAEHP